MDTKETVEQIKRKRPLILMIFYIIILVFLLARIYTKMFAFYITIKFDEVAPITKSIPVFYKGFKVGHTTDIRPTPDYKFTLVRVIFTSSVSLLPDNTTAKVKHKVDENNKNKSKIYIELIYPDSPSVAFLRKGSIINGMMEPDINTFMSDAIESGALSNITTNMNRTLASAEKTSDALRDVFVSVNDLISKMSPNLVSASDSLAVATKNLADMSVNLNDMSRKFNNAVSEERIDNMFANVYNSTNNLNAIMENVEKVSGNVNTATEKLDDTITVVNSTLCEVRATASNLKNITGGVCKLLTKRFAGMKLFFGKPFDDSSGCACECGK